MNLQNYLRELERRQRQAIDRYNQEVRRQQRAIDDYNRKVDDHNRKVINAYNTEVKKYNDDVRRAVNDYNREVRAHNNRVTANRQRLRSALAALGHAPVTTPYVTLRTSVEAVSNAYVRLEQYPATNLGGNYNRIIDLSEREAANSVEVYNAMLGNLPLAETPKDDLEDAALTDELRRLSPDLDKRWQGAVFALNPGNPDAARHFCTSAREILTTIIDTYASDAAVVDLLPNCERTPQGTPTRRSKVRFFLQRKGIAVQPLEEFIDQDMQNIIELFQVFNQGTHGSAGTFGFPQLRSIRKRVEDGIFFLSRIVI